MDARPTIVDGKIKLALSLSIDNSTLMALMDSKPASNARNWSQSMTVIVESGKPLVVVENSDPANNRKLSIEVKATILK